MNDRHISKLRVNSTCLSSGTLSRKGTVIGLKLVSGPFIYVVLINADRLMLKTASVSLAVIRPVPNISVIKVNSDDSSTLVSTVSNMLSYRPLSPSVMTKLTIVLNSTTFLRFRPSMLSPL